MTLSYHQPHEKKKHNKSSLYYFQLNSLLKTIKLITPCDNYPSIHKEKEPHPFILDAEKWIQKSLLTRCLEESSCKKRKRDSVTSRWLDCQRERIYQNFLLFRSRITERIRGYSLDTECYIKQYIHFLCPHHSACRAPQFLSVKIFTFFRKHSRSFSPSSVRRCVVFPSVPFRSFAHDSLFRLHLSLSLSLLPLPPWIVVYPGSSTACSAVCKASSKDPRVCNESALFSPFFPTRNIQVFGVQHARARARAETWKRAKERAGKPQRKAGGMESAGFEKSG